MLRTNVFAFAVLASSCNVEPIQGNTGGVPDARVPGRCPQGLTVLLTDFLSTQVALSALDGTTLSPSFLSTSSAKTDGLAFAFSGDVVLPGERPPSGRIVLIDRYGTNVVTFADPRDARVVGQVSVGTGYEANPYDYIEVDGTRAYVSRFGHNGAPGREPFDGGDDILILDTRAIEIIGRIPLAAPGDGAPPRPTRFARLGDEVLISLERASLDFESLEDSELVGLDPTRDQVSWRTKIDGMKGCGGAVASPSGRELVLACTGGLTVKGDTREPSTSGIVVLDATVRPPAVAERLAAERLGGQALQSEIAFMNDHVVLLKTQTGLSTGENNRLLAWDRMSGEVNQLLEARPTTQGRGLGVVYGALLCDPACSDTCWLADADRGVLQRLRLKDGNPIADAQVRVEHRVGLPPRGLAYR